jgi:hypothetical protein
VVFLDRFSKNTQTSNFMKILPVAAESFDANGRTDGRTDGRAGGRAGRQAGRQAGRRAGRQALTNMANLIVAFRNFSKAPENCARNGCKKLVPSKGTVITKGTLGLKVGVFLVFYQDVALCQ